MNVALFGGRFDPPHVGHLFVANQILDFRKDIDKVIFVPANQHQWKNTMANASQRMDMLDLISSENIEVSDLELRRGGISYSIDTIREIKKERECDVFWIVGSDILNEFDKWHKSEDLIREAKFIVFPRDPYHLPNKIPEGFEIVRSDLLITSNLSSTIIRERIRKGYSIKGYVDSKIEEYIKANNLYQNE